MGFIDIEFLTDDKIFSFEIEANELHELNIRGTTIKSPDKICKISIIKNMFIVKTEDRDFRDNSVKVAPIYKSDRRINNINAYDWNGNHLWNIGDIVGDIKMPFRGCGVTTRAQLLDEKILDPCDSTSNELCSCLAEGTMFYIDPFTRKLLKTKSGFK